MTPGQTKSWCAEKYRETWRAEKGRLQNDRFVVSLGFHLGPARFTETCPNVAALSPVYQCDSQLRHRHTQQKRAATLRSRRGRTLRNVTGLESRFNGAKTCRIGPLAACKSMVGRELTAPPPVSVPVPVPVLTQPAARNAGRDAGKGSARVIHKTWCAHRLPDLCRVEEIGRHGADWMRTVCQLRSLQIPTAVTLSATAASTGLSRHGNL
jgi:hypothetical protein